MEAIRLECQTCGGSIALSADGKSGRCEFCGNVYHYREPKSPAVIMGLNEANAYRLNNDFDSAIIKYRSVLTQVHDDADVYWGLTRRSTGSSSYRMRTGGMCPRAAALFRRAYWKAKVTAGRSSLPHPSRRKVSGGRRGR